VLVAGDGADNLPKQCGGWTISWQGDGNTRADFPNGQTIFEAIRDTVQAAGGAAALSVDGTFRDRPDVAVVVFGENPYAEFQGDRANVDYQSGNRRDLKLVQSLKAQGIPVVSVFLSGRPLYVTPEINASNAFIAAWLPGSEGAGIADMLFRKADGSIAYEFRGTLAYSWPRGPEQTPLNADTEPYYPLFPLGYGLTYSIRKISAHCRKHRRLLRPRRTSTAMFDDGRIVQPVEARIVFERHHRACRCAFGIAAGNTLSASRNRLTPRLATWTPGQVSDAAAMTGPKINLMRETDADMALTLTLRVDRAPTARVSLGVGCGAQCHGSVDVTSRSDRRAGYGATTIAVRLACFRGPGADMRSIDTPLQLSSSGALKLHIYSVCGVPGQGAATCPTMPSG
jgi:beta-glucosidase